MVQNTALHLTSREGHTAAVMLLLERGAKITLNKTDNSFLHEAVFSGRKETMDSVIKSARLVHRPGDTTSLPYSQPPPASVGSLIPCMPVGMSVLGFLALLRSLSGWLLCNQPAGSVTLSIEAQNVLIVSFEKCVIVPLEKYCALTEV